MYLPLSLLQSYVLSSLLSLSLSLALALLFDKCSYFIAIADITALIIIKWWNDIYLCVFYARVYSNLKFA